MLLFQFHSNRTMAVAFNIHSAARIITLLIKNPLWQEKGKKKRREPEGHPSALHATGSVK